MINHDPHPSFIFSFPHSVATFLTGCVLCRLYRPPPREVPGPLLLLRATPEAFLSWSRCTAVAGAREALPSSSRARRAARRSSSTLPGRRLGAAPRQTARARRVAAQRPASAPVDPRRAGGAGGGQLDLRQRWRGPGGGRRGVDGTATAAHHPDGLHALLRHSQAGSIILVPLGSL